MSILMFILFGLIVGFLARAIMPGRQSMGFLGTALVGVAGSFVGGVIGILLGVGSSRLLSAKMGWETLTSPESIVTAFVFSAAIGIFFGFYPARKAAKLDPIDDLRYE